MCCTGAASKRFGIDGDREAVPLTLDVAYNRVRNGLNPDHFKVTLKEKRKGYNAILYIKEAWVKPIEQNI